MTTDRGSSFVAVDPGLRNPAAAIFRFGRLVAASRVKPDPKWTSLDIGERCRLVAGRLQEWLYAHGVSEPYTVEAYHAEVTGDLPRARALRAEYGLERLVVEWPQIYRAGKSKGDPNDLPPLVGIVMCLAGKLDVPVTSYKPAEWIGQIKKVETGDPLNSPRGKLIWRNLDAAERLTVTLSHDAIDAIGIGLFDLKRLHRRIYASE